MTYLIASRTCRKPLVTEMLMVTCELNMRYQAPFRPLDNKPLELKYSRKAGLPKLKCNNKTNL